MMDANAPAQGRSKPKQPFLRRGTGLKRYGLAKARAFGAEQPAEKVVPPKPWKPGKKTGKSQTAKPKVPSSTVPQATKAANPDWNTAPAPTSLSSDLSGNAKQQSAALPSSRQAQAFVVEEEQHGSHSFEASSTKQPQTDSGTWDDTPVAAARTHVTSHTHTDSHLRHSQPTHLSLASLSQRAPIQPLTPSSPDHTSSSSAHDDLASELSFLLSQSQFEAQAEKERADLAEFEQLESIVTPVTVRDSLTRSWTTGGQASPSLRGLPSLKSPPRHTLATSSPPRSASVRSRATKVLAPAPTLDDSAAWSDGTRTPEPQRRITAPLTVNHDYRDYADNDDNYDIDDNGDDHADHRGWASGQSTPTPSEPAVRRSASSTLGDAPRPQSKLMQRFFGHTQSQHSGSDRQSQAGQRDVTQASNLQHQMPQSAVPAAIVARVDVPPPTDGALAQLEAEIALFKRETAALDALKQQHARTIKQLNDEMAEFQKQRQQAEAAFEQEKEEELRKLKRQRHVLDTHREALRNAPSKQTRDEVEELRQDNDELRRQLAQSDKKHGMAVHRYQDQVQRLKSEVNELQAELSQLEQLRLSEQRAQRPPSSTERLPSGQIGKYAIKQPSKYATAPRHAAVQNGSHTGGQPYDDGPASSDDDDDDDDDVVAVYHEAQQTELLHDAAFDDNLDNLDNEDSDPWSPVPRVDPPNDKRYPLAHARQALRSSGKTEGDVVIAEDLAEDGSRTTHFANGTFKQVHADGRVVVKFFNEDVKQTLSDGTVVYFYSQAGTTHTSKANGAEVYAFANGQTEHHYPDGSQKIDFPDGTSKRIAVNGDEETQFVDGTVQHLSVSGEKIIDFPDGQQEVHTKAFSKRRYPDGTVKIVYPDGRQETQYASGRVRIKDATGQILVDRVVAH